MLSFTDLQDLLPPPPPRPRPLHNAELCIIYICKAQQWGKVPLNLFQGQFYFFTFFGLPCWHDATLFVYLIFSSTCSQSITFIQNDTIHSSVARFLSISSSLVSSVLKNLPGVNFKELSFLYFLLFYWYFLWSRPIKDGEERFDNRWPVNSLKVSVFDPVLRIRDILVRIRVRGSVPLTNWSGSASCYFRQFLLESSESMTKIAGCGSVSISQRHGSADPDPDPVHLFQEPDPTWTMFWPLIKICCQTGRDHQNLWNVKLFSEISLNIW